MPPGRPGCCSPIFPRAPIRGSSKPSRAARCGGAVRRRRGRGKRADGCARPRRGGRAGAVGARAGGGGARMSLTRFITLYSRTLAWAGTVLLVATLAADQRWTGQVPEIVVLFACAVALRGLHIPLSKYSYLTQTGLVALAGSLLVGVPATALALAGATLTADALWLRKALRVAWINLGREVIALVAAY